MLLNTITANILHKQLVDENNIIYYPSNSIFDHTMYLIDNNFFVFADIPSFSENCKCLSESLVDLYQYDTCCSNEIIAYRQHKTLVNTMHIGHILFEHSYRKANLKKEDLYIINQSTLGTTKIFFNTGIAESWGLNNSLVINYGIPTEMFYPNNKDKESDVLILTENSITAHQLIQHINQTFKGTADVLPTLANMKISDINTLLNKYKILINLNNTTIDSLCAASAGLQVISVSQIGSADTKLLSVPNVNYASSIQKIVQLLSSLMVNNIKNSDDANKYLAEKFNLDNFKNEMGNVLDKVKREACII